MGPQRNVVQTLRHEEAARKENCERTGNATTIAFESGEGECPESALLLDAQIMNIRTLTCLVLSSPFHVWTRVWREASMVVALWACLVGAYSEDSEKALGGP